MHAFHARPSQGLFPPFPPPHTRSSPDRIHLSTDCNGVPRRTHVRMRSNSGEQIPVYPPILHVPPPHSPGCALPS